MGEEDDGFDEYEEQDVEETSNLMVLGMIPNYSVDKKATAKGGKKH